MERPQTARPSRKSNVSPYHALPGSANVLGLQVRPKTAGVAPSIEGAWARSVYVRAPRPPPSTLREYVPLHPRAQISGHVTGGNGRSWRDDSEGEENAQPAVVFDSVRDHSHIARPTSARIAVGPSNTMRKPPPMSARGRMQSDSALPSRDADRECNRLPAAGYDHESDYEDESRGDVAIFPAPSKSGFIPPQPLMQDPSPRRRPMSTHVSTASSSELKRMPATAEPHCSPHGHGTRLQGDTAGDAARSRGAMLHDLAPVMCAIASLTHETHLGKLARQIDAVVLVLMEADASRLVLYNNPHKVLHVVRPGDSDHQIANSSQYEYDVEGITGMCAQASATINVPNLHDNRDVKVECDLGRDSLPATQHVSYLAVPARDKAGNVVAVISAVRMGVTAKPFEGEAVEIMELIAQQAGVAVASCLQRREMNRAKMHSKILVKAAVELTSAVDLDVGSLTMLASAYGKKLADCESVVVCLTHQRNQFLRSWTLVDSDVHRHDTDKTLLAGEVRLEERSHIPVPVVLKNVVTTGSVANLLLHGRALHAQDGELAHLNDPNLVCCTVLGSQSIEYQRDSDSCLAVPVQTEPGATIMGVVIATNKLGGPRKAGKAGIFTALDEEALRDLSSILAGVLVNILRGTDLESAIALAPALTQHQDAPMALTEACKICAKPLKAHSIFIFTLEQDGNYLLHPHDLGALDPIRDQPNVNKKKSGVLARVEMDTQKDAAKDAQMPLSNQPVRLPGNSYPLAAAVQSREALQVRIHDVSEMIINKKKGLLSSASDMLACAIRDLQGNLYGVMIVATLNHQVFPHYSVRLLGHMASQLGAVLQGCSHFQHQASHIAALKFASTEMLKIVNKREIKSVIDHVDSEVREFMCCSRAVLYMVDRPHNVVWTTVKLDPHHEHMLTHDIKADVDPKSQGSRVGYVNATLYSGAACTVKDFAYGQEAYSDILDSADINHVIKLLKMQSGAYDVATTAIMRAELEPQQRTHSILAVPVRDSEGRNIIAVLQVMNRFKSVSLKTLRKEGFDSHDLDKLVLVAAAVSSTLETCARLNRQWHCQQQLRSVISSSGDGMQVCMGATSRVNLTDALSFVAKSALSKCHATQVAVYLLDDQGHMDVIRFEGNLCVPCKRVKAAVCGIAGLTMRSGEIHNIVDAHKHAHFIASVDEKQMLPVASTVVCPIRDPNGKIVGALAFQNKKATGSVLDDTDPFRAHGAHSSRKAIILAGHDSGWQAFDSCDERVLQAAAHGLGVALSHCTLFDLISNVSERLKDISLELEMDRTCDAIAHACRQLCKASHCLVWVLDDKTSDMVCPMSSANYRIPASYGIAGAVRKRGTSQFYTSIHDLDNLAANEHGGVGAGNDRYHLDAYHCEYQGLWNAMGVPMVDAQGRILGVLEIGNKVGRSPFTAQDERLIKVLASHAYTSIKHCRVYEATLAKVDGTKHILRQVVTLVKQVAVSFPQTLEYASAYRAIVDSTCQVLGCLRGTLYVGLGGAHRQWMAYDRDGKQVKERCCQTAARVMETGTLMNNTKVAGNEWNCNATGGRYSNCNASAIPATGDASAIPATTTTDDDLKDAQMMVAPITLVDPLHLQGTVVCPLSLSLRLSIWSVLCLSLCLCLVCGGVCRG